MFSPYYARARRRGPANPLDHVGFNVALYGPRASRWALTERGGGKLSRGADHLAVGPSTLSWNPGGLDAEINEIGAPLPYCVRGRIRLHPEPATPVTFKLDPAGRHRWTPLAPRARIEVALERPALRWQGTAYLDSNDGDAPLEQDLVGWDWSRSHGRGGTRIYYDVTARTGANVCHGVHYGLAGEPDFIPVPPRRELVRTGLWRVPRTTRAAMENRLPSVRTLEDTPFYARSLLHGQDNESTIQESLSLDRFRQPIVQLMLPFRMRRVAT